MPKFKCTGCGLVIELAGMGGKEHIRCPKTLSTVGRFTQKQESKMEIKQVHAHFLISIGNYSNERIGFSVELEPGETPETVVPQLREKATVIVGRPASELYDEKYRMETAIRNLEAKLNELRKEWDATAEFLKAQGIRPDAPPMPQFNRLLAAAKVEEESVTDGEIDVF